MPRSRDARASRVGGNLHPGTVHLEAFDDDDDPNRPLKLLHGVFLTVHTKALRHQFRIARKAAECYSPRRLTARPYPEIIRYRICRFDVFVQ